MALIIRLLAVCLFCVTSIKGASVAGVSLPAGVKVVAMQQDSSGNLYIAGTAIPMQPKSSADTSDVYVAGSSPDGSTVIWSATLGGSNVDSAAGLAVTSTGSLYVTGTTSSADFPVTASAAQGTFQAAGYQAFLAVFDNRGKLQNATFLGGAANSQGYDVALTVAGQPVVTGYAGTGFISSANAPAFSATSLLIELDAAISHLIFASPVGGQHVALDSAGNIYVAGNSYGGSAGPMTPGAFQTTISLRGCGGTIFVGFACNYQYLATASAPPQATSNPHPEVFPPPQTGYVTKLNSLGTGLVFSTFLGGTFTDSVTGLALAADGSVYVTGFAQSADFPGLEGDPAACFPEFFLARITADGSAIGHTTVFSPDILCPQCSVTAQAALLSLNWRNSPALIVGSQVIANVNVTGVAPKVACVLDSADLQPVSTVAPGQLLSFFFSTPTGIAASTATRPAASTPRKSTRSCS